MQTVETQKPTPVCRPPSTKAQIFSAVCSCVALGGLLVGYLQISNQVRTHNTNERLEGERRAREAYGKLYPMDIDIWKFVAAHPYISKCLLDDADGTRVEKLTPEERVVFDANCQMIGDMFEYYFFVEADLTNQEWARRNNCWEPYIELLYKNSAGFRQYIRATDAEWTDILKKKLASIENTAMPEEK